MSKVDEISQDLARRLRAGEWRPGESFLTMREIQDEYGVSGNATVQAVLWPLRDAGVLRMEQGKATVVARLDPLRQPAEEDDALAQAETILGRLEEDLASMRQQVTRARALIASAR